MGSARRAPSPLEESRALDSLKRGVYARKEIQKGQEIRESEVFFAMPLLGDGLSSGMWREGMIADKKYSKDEVLSKELGDYQLTDAQKIESILIQIKGMLRDAAVDVGRKSNVELSHHYGISRFREYGAAIIDVINREYCKKIIVQLPRQKHPYHLHKKKEETFQILYGDLEVERNGEPFYLRPGDLLLVEPNEWHKFSTLDGAVFEEISTTHYDNDSFYQDEYIDSLPRKDRKTLIENWQL
jgi:N-acetylneuraminate synthase